MGGHDNSAPDIRRVLQLKLVTYGDARRFLDRCKSWLLERSDLHHTMCSSLLLIDSESPVYTGPYWFGVVEDSNGNVVACGNHSLPDGLCISEIPEDMMHAVYQSIVDSVGVPYRIVAPQLTAASLAKRCSEISNVSMRFDNRWLTYRLDEAIGPVAGVSGCLRKGRKDEEGLIAEWGQAFEKEDPTPFNVSDFMLRKRSDGDLYVWDDEGPRTIVTLSGPAGKGIRISGVYTPHEFRGRGYASAAVAQISHAELANGREFMVLNVVEGRPAVRIYERLGYRLIGSRDCYLTDNERPYDMANIPLVAASPCGEEEGQ